MAHLHITGWVIAVILVFVVSNLYKKGKEKSGKIWHMILRLFYLVILFSGISLFFAYNEKPGLLFLKVLVGLWVITAMEMVTIKTNKKLPTKSWWIQFVIALVLALILGFGMLPLGVLP